MIFKKHTTSFLTIFIVLFLFAGCKKTEVISVPNNNTPIDNTLSDLTKKNYINKVYISVLGREPNETELITNLNLLNSGNFSSEKRNQFIDEIVNKPGYAYRNWLIASTELLNGTDTADASLYIAIFSSLLTNTSYQSIWPVLEVEIHKLQLLRNIPTALEGDSLDIIGMHKRVIYNYFYDQINMGSSNFVTATFQNFLYRYPSETELSNGINMVDGFNSALFFQTGNSKTDFIELFFNSDNYFEGQVRALFTRYLFRQPSSAEMTSFSIQYKSSKDYKALQKRILTLDEYVGIN